VCLKRGDDLSRVDFYKTSVIGENGKEILIYNGEMYTAVVIVKYLDFFGEYEVSKFVKTTGMTKRYKYDEDFVIIVESTRSAKLVEKELRKINFNNRIIDNDYYALEKLARGENLKDETYYEEPYYE